MNLVEWFAQYQTQASEDLRTQIALQQTQAYVGAKTHVSPARDYTELYAGPYRVGALCCTSGPTKTNCCNCGAALRSFRCEYCGTINN